jgi:hypothetical protein
VCYVQKLQGPKEAASDSTKAAPVVAAVKK